MLCNSYLIPNLFYDLRRNGKELDLPSIFANSPLNFAIFVSREKNKTTGMREYSRVKRKIRKPCGVL